MSFVWQSVFDIQPPVALGGLPVVCGFSFLIVGSRRAARTRCCLSDCYGCFVVRLADSLEDKNVRRLRDGCDRRDEELVFNLQP